MPARVIAVQYLPTISAQDRLDVPSSSDAERSAGRMEGRELAQLCADLDRRYATCPAESVFGAAREHFPRLVLVSSFGAEAAVLLAMAAEIDPALPVFFIDTGKHFPETLDYVDRLVARLGLTGMRRLGPDGGVLAASDPDGNLHRRDPEQCCALRKTAPLAAALLGVDAWVSGRRRDQSATRSQMRLFEIERGGDAERVKVNPLSGWSSSDIASEMRRRDLPVHPLVRAGYLSIGCAPCTTPVAAGEDARAGRWRGLQKLECGIHGRLDVTQA